MPTGVGVSSATGEGDRSHDVGGMSKTEGDAGRRPGDPSLPANALAHNWDTFRYFIAVARGGSFSQAAKALRESQPTVRRRITELETALGVKLVARGSNGVSLTSSGRTAYEFMRRIEVDAEAMRERVLGLDTQTRGQVIVSVPDGFGHVIIVPRLKDFQEQFPDIDLVLLIGNRRFNLLNREADLALRIGDPVHGSLIGRKIGTVRFGLFAHESYLAERPVPQTESDLAGHRIIDCAGVLEHSKQGTALRARTVHSPRVVRLDSTVAQHSAAMSGLGIAALPRYMVRDTDGLVELLPGFIEEVEDIRILLRPDLKGVERARVVADFLTRIARGAVAPDREEPRSAQA